MKPARMGTSFLLAAALACGGKAPPPPPAVPVPETASSRAPAPPPPPASAVPLGAAALAPAPQIRVGLSTSARGVRLTSSGPFVIGAPDPIVETSDVYIEPDSSAVIEGAVFRVQLRSFATEAQARAYREMLREELDEGGVLWREPQSGRYAVRLGSFTTEAGARERLQALDALGLEPMGVVREPTGTSRPTELVLRPLGEPTIRTSSLTLVAAPRALGRWIEVDGIPYRGYLELFVNPSNLFTLVNVVNLEDYLKGVVPAELSPRAFPEKEAIKAQTLAARTYAVKRRGQYAAEGYDICDTAACQVYRGVAIEEPMATSAVVETAGEVLTYDGKLVDALYTSTCGGRTENAENIFSRAEPYLVSRACYLERQGDVVRASPDSEPLPLEEVVLSKLGIVSEVGELEVERVTETDARRWVERAVAQLGQTPCWSSASASSRPLDLVGLGNLLGEGLCWERRLPFLISPPDAARTVPNPALSASERRHLAYAIEAGLIHPHGDGIVPGRALARREIVETLFRLIARRGEAPLHEGTLDRIVNGRLFLTDDTLGDEDNKVAMLLAPERHLYRHVGESTYYASELMLLPGDHVRFRRGDAGIDVLVLLSGGASFDRTSRLSHWVVRKSNEDLSREINLRGSVGEVTELRPKRYGLSGRIVELEVVGTLGSLELTGLEVRRALGIRENLFFIDRQRASDGSATGWVFTGRGWGHGVGMCQVGAYGMAAAGYDYRQILTHYYLGTRIEHLTDLQAPVDVDKP